MNKISGSKLPAALLGLAIAVLCSPALPDDIDLFVNAKPSTTSNPNILFIIDNTANWSRQDEHFPGFTYNGQSASTQGAAEVAAIATALNALSGSQASQINVGLMEFENKAQAGGQIGYAVQQMTPTNLTNFVNILTNTSTAIFNNITNPSYKIAQTTPYGGLMEDAYNYFSGNAPLFSYNPPPNVPLDVNGYTDSTYAKFKAPSGSGCQHNYIIFIGNPPSNGPASDDGSNTDPNNSSQLAKLGGSTTQPPVSQFSVGNIYTNLGSSSLCYAQTAAGLSSCTATEPGLNPGYSSQCSSYSSCQCGSTYSTALPSCSSLAYPSGDARYTVFGNTNANTSTNSATTTSTQNGVNTGTLTSCVADTQAVLAANFACSKSQPSPPASPACPSGSSCSVVSTGTSCGNGGKVYWNYDKYTPAPPAAPACPATSTTTTAPVAGPGPNQTQTTTTTTSWASCTDSASTASATGCSANQHTFQIFGNKTTQSYTTTTTTTDTQTTLGNTVACYASGSCATTDYSSQASSYNGGLSCAAPTTQTGTCPNGEVTFQVQGVTQGETPTGTTAVIQSKYLPLNANLWAQFMRQQGIATTYAIDVYGAAPNAIQSELLNSMAQLGGGKYYSATNEQAIATAINGILQEIQSVNTAFASAALPVNSANRAQNENEVYIGQFRPDPNANTRWFGNLKRYQLIYNTTTGSTDLGDANGAEAINSQTGFLADCAVSFWTSAGVSNYWASVSDDNPAPGGTCPPNSTTNPSFSDTPDGPTVEKGAVSEVLRLGNGNSTTTDPAATRNMFTISSGSTVAFNSANVPSLSQQLINFTLGEDVYGEASGGSPANPMPASTSPRPSIHGDVIHSRPLPVNYGGTIGDVVFYGDNDGPYRAVNAGTGKELWSFIAPEFLSRLNRQMTDSPSVQYFPTEPNTKDYFFDGSTGLYQSLNNTSIWIYPSMRRGGRKVYAFNVTTPTSTPTLLWSAGCPDLGDDVGCTADKNGVSMSGIGQTWSLPNVAFIKGYTSTATANPDSTLVVMGGGYDACEDTNTATPSCGSPKGNVVYVLDGYDGHVIAQFPTARSVAADVSLVDVNGDGYVDYAYAADTGGNLYRISFVDANTNPLAPAAWTMTKIAYMDQTTTTPGPGRKFLFGPELLPVNGGYVYVALGSGDREHPLITEYPVTGYPGSTPVHNRFYVYLDNPTSTSTTATDLDTDPAVVNYSAASCSSQQLLPGGSLKGWYLNLSGTGEETESSALIVEGQVAFSTNTPTSPTAGACTSLGTAQGYLVSLFNGSGAIGVTGICGGAVSSTFTGGGLPPSPVLAQVPVSTPNGTEVQIVVIGVASKSGPPSGGLSASNSSPFSPVNMTPNIAGPRKGVFWKKTGDN